MSLLFTRNILTLASGTQRTFRLIYLLMCDFAATTAFGYVVSLVVGTFLYEVYSPHPPPLSTTAAMTIAGALDGNAVLKDSWTLLYIYPSQFTSLWLWLYAGSGFLLKAARRFDVGFQWFNSHFDIGKKPLQAIGLVAGVLVAVSYWGFALAVWAL